MMLLASAVTKCFMRTPNIYIIHTLDDWPVADCTFIIAHLKQGVSINLINMNKTFTFGLILFCVPELIRIWGPLLTFLYNIIIYIIYCDNRYSGRCTYLASIWITLLPLIRPLCPIHVYKIDGGLGVAKGQGL